jgi:hypothetical protein
LSVVAEYTGYGGMSQTMLRGVNFPARFSAGMVADWFGEMCRLVVFSENPSLSAVVEHQYLVAIPAVAHFHAR